MFGEMLGGSGYSSGQARRDSLGRHKEGPINVKSEGWRETAQKAGR